MSLFYFIKGKKYLYLAFDIFIIIISYYLSYGIRFYPELNRYPFLITKEYLFLVTLSYIAPYYIFQIYRIMWAYSNINDVYRLILSNVAGFFIFISTIYISKYEYSSSIIVLSFMIISVSGIFYRILIRDYYSKNPVSTNESENELQTVENYKKKKILIIGAGEAGRGILSEYKKTGKDRQIVGFIDDDKDKIGKIFNGKLIFSSTKGMNSIIRKLGVNEILIAMPSAGANEINRIVSIIKNENQAIPIKILPSMIEIFDDKPLVSLVRDVSIDDLLGREELRVDEKSIRKRFEGKTVLITGAGGSIGSEICKQMLRFNIKKLIAVGRGEFSIYNLVKTLNEYIEFIEVRPEIIYRIIDVKDYKLLELAFSEFKPDIVFHAAAHKHVPLMEYNEIEALQNNVGSTINILELSSRYNTEEFVLISTDKAVNPVSIMGATKRIAEIITIYYNKKKGIKTSIVRFGNVIGSRGSAIPLFREQIEKGGPVTITHPEITRYFMSIPEASLLVINAAAYSAGGEMFILDMGKQYKVIDIAKRLIELYGYKAGSDIKIEISGLRPGEKMFEELYYDTEKLIETGNKKIFILSLNDDHYDDRAIENFIKNDLQNIRQKKSLEIRNMIKSIVPEFDFKYSHESGNKSNKYVN